MICVTLLVWHNKRDTLRYIEIVEMLERESGQSDGEDEATNVDEETKDEQSALLDLTQKHPTCATGNGGMEIENDTDDSASTDSEGSTDSGTTRTGQGLVAYTLSLFHL